MPAVFLVWKAGFACRVVCMAWTGLGFLCSPVLFSCFLALPCYTLPGKSSASFSSPQHGQCLPAWAGTGQSPRAFCITSQGSGCCVLRLVGLVHGMLSGAVGSLYISMCKLWQYVCQKGLRNVCLSSKQHAPSLVSQEWAGAVQSNVVCVHHIKAGMPDEQAQTLSVFCRWLFVSAEGWYPVCNLFL